MQMKTLLQMSADELGLLSLSLSLSLSETPISAASEVGERPAWQPNVGTAAMKRC